MASQFGTTFTSSSHTSGLKCSLAFFPGFWLREEVNDFLLILLPLQHSFILLSFKCFEGGIFLLVLGWGKHSLALLADSHDALTKLDKHRGHVDIHVELIVASQPNVNGRDLDGLAPLAQMVELLPYQPARLDGSVHSQGVVDLGGPGLSSQVGLVTVDQAPVAVVITGLASVAQGPAEPLAISAGPENESELNTIELERIAEEQVTVKVQNLGAD